MDEKPIYEKWHIGDEYRKLIKGALVNHHRNDRFIESPMRMREVMHEFMANRSITEVANDAGVNETIVQKLINDGVAPYPDTRRVMKALKINATALPAECVPVLPGMQAARQTRRGTSDGGPERVARLGRIPPPVRCRRPGGLPAAMFDWMIHTQPDLFPVEITGWEETPGTVRIFALSIYGSACEAMYEGTVDGFIRERISQRKGEPRL